MTTQPHQDMNHAAACPPLERTSCYEPPTYQMYGVMNALKDALRPHLKAGEMLMWRDAFRWHNDKGVLSNHYECMGLAQLCGDFGYEVIHDFRHVAVVRSGRTI